MDHRQPDEHPLTPGRAFPTWAFAHYFRGLFRKNFASVRWAALHDPAAWDRQVPTLFLANHTNWWDGFLGFLLTRELGFAHHVLMEAVHLNRYRIFKAIGTLPVRRDSLRGGYADLEAAGRVLEPGAALWIYPQGSRRPAGAPVGKLERGAAHLAVQHQGPLRICPVAFRYPFLSEQLPEAFALIGEPWLHDGVTDRTALTLRFESALSGTLARLDADVLHLDEGSDRPSTIGHRPAAASYRLLIPGRLSLNKRLDQFRHRAGLLQGDFERRNG